MPERLWFLRFTAVRVEYLIVPPFFVATVAYRYYHLLRRKAMDITSRVYTALTGARLGRLSLQPDSFL